MFANLTKPDITKGERGAMIVFEGLDRSGKSSQAKLLVEKLTANGIPAEYTPFPNRQTETGKKIDMFLRNELELADEEIHLLFSANRKEVKDVMVEKLKSGVTLIVDRYSYSGAAFTAAKQKPGMDLKWCFEPEIGLVAPDAVLYLNVSQEVQLKRGGFGAERYESVAFQEKARAKFDRLIDLSPTWGSYKEVLKAQSKDKLPTDLNTESAPVDAFISPWYKVNADMDYNDVTLCVNAAAADIFNTVKSQPIKYVGQFPDI